MNTSFLINQAVLLTLLFSIYYASGKLVLNKGVKVNYTRKINHFALFFLPHLLNMVLVFQKSTLTITISLGIAIMTLGLFIEPLRQRSSVLRTIFLSFDRPEDRPHTLLWLTTQYIAAAAVIIPLGMGFAAMQKAELVFIPILINGLGDGLAEPVGVRFGRIKYSTRALFSDKRYERSLEGSLCVFLAGLLCIIAFRHSFTPVQFIAALAAIPIAATLAEAFSPHTWDTPFIFGVTGVSCICILTFL